MSVVALNAVDRPEIWDLVLGELHKPFAWRPFGVDTDMTVIEQMVTIGRARDAVGIATYPERLKPFNGRQVLIDVRDEMFDQLAYLRQAVFEAEAAAVSAAQSASDPDADDAARRANREATSQLVFLLSFYQRHLNAAYMFVQWTLAQ